MRAVVSAEAEVSKLISSKSLIMKRNFFVFAILFLQGCSVVRPYPICFCNEKPSATQYSKIEKDISNILSQYTRNDNTIAFSTDHRWAFVKTTNSENRKIIKIWARVACIGKKNDDTQLEIYKRCIEYINKVLEKQDYFMSEDKRQGFLYCGGDPF